MITAHNVQANGLTLHYHRTGNDKPPMILLHGITDHGLCWEDVVTVLQADYDLILPDVRGHGLSDVPPSNNTFKPLVEDVVALIQALDIEKPILFGHSLGAITSLSLAGFYPDLPKAIILEDPPPWWMPVDGDANETIAIERVQGAHEWLTLLQSKPLDALIAMQKAETPHWSDTELRNWADAKLKVSLDVPDLFGANDYHAWDWDELLATVACPTLLIRADVEQGAIVTPESADYLLGHVQLSEVAHIAGAGHSIHRDKFDDMMGVVKAFLGKYDC